MWQDKLPSILEGALLAAGEPLSLDRLHSLFEEAPGAEEAACERPTKAQIRDALHTLEATYRERGVVLREVASGYLFQVSETVTPWVRPLWSAKPLHYSRALLEVLAIIADRQPITRGEIEEIRGVSTHTKLMHTLLEHDWVRVTGHRSLPGRPALYGTTNHFLDHFGLTQLSELPAINDSEGEGLNAEPLFEAVAGSEKAGADADDEVTDGDPLSE